jgi:branched-chain amino acid transport system ATP-binding protein
MEEEGAYMKEPILRVNGLTKSFGGLIAVNNVDFHLPSKELHAIIGPNGAGKTTFFNLISGFLTSDSGRIMFYGQDILGKPPHKISQMGMARTLQVKSVFNGLTVYDNVWIAAHSRARFLNPFRPTKKYKDTARQVERILEEMEIASHAYELAGNLSYGDMGLVEIAIALATKPRLLLLDEPIAGMSPEETDRTVAKIRELSKTLGVILIDHDMEVVFGVADTITVMNQGTILSQGPPKQVARDKRVQEAYLGSPDEEEALDAEA